MDTKYIEELLISKSKDILFKADEIRKKNLGDGVHLRALIEASNYCVKNCLYCGLRRDNKKIKRYRMSYKEITEVAEKAYNMGFKTVVIQSGEDPILIKDLCMAVYEIKKRFDLRITLSNGVLKKSDYADLKNSGADRYLLKFETSDKKLYEYLRPGCVFGDRLKALEELKKLGYQIGTGIMVGLPLQTDKILSKDLKLLSDIEADMISVGPFIPHTSTPLKGSDTVEELKALKSIAITRVLSPYAHMPATTSMGVLYPSGRKKALLAGANVIMPDITPSVYSKKYIIYPGKNIKDPEDSLKEIKEMLLSISRYVSEDYGDSVIRGVYERKNS